MCRFDGNCCTRSAQSLYISIHLMCRFDINSKLSLKNRYEFQYISCVGSIFIYIVQFKCFYYFNTSHVSVRSKKRSRRLSMLKNFNTSHVSVRSLGDPGSCKGCVISIHLMCRFDKFLYVISSGLTPFQYISCVGSIFSGRSNRGRNTISIHLMCRFDTQSDVDLLNANPFQYISCVGSMMDEAYTANRLKRFQYISCVGSIPLLDRLIERHILFQYISCVGSIYAGLDIVAQLKLFQYISCVGSIFLKCT